MKNNKPAIHGETLESLTERLAAIGEKPFRAKQILEWLYKKRARSPEEMTNLSAKLRTWLAEEFEFAAATPILQKTASDVTDKLLLKLQDGSLIETVIIRAPQVGVGQDKSRKTICISTQVGCAYGCRFCASGLAGWKRDLSVGEIVAQLIEVCRQEDPTTDRAREELASFDNIVVMGMGEPLANYDSLLPALGILNAPWGLGFGARRITISTSGLVPQIERLADEPMGFRLAISLHGATDEVREQIMPVNRKYPLAKLLPAAKHFAEKHGRMLTLEFILIEDINDSLDQAHALKEIARKLHAHVNLIPYNTVQGLDWKRPSVPQQEAFANVLRGARVSVTLRREKGHDINAACGQLRLQHEEAGGISPVPAKR
ncbi:23S rRNA (adenine(2503)-C(2))-methyltransferase RlmN [Rubellicoccus peritrichatus]|uniref:Probable dual-specificity RNA methyltransferase RlmN n=1 Tax=Rubellicoccus peritrichatus TaxID=3080537 RepID=A0AAQ3QVT1_9BACT|nr:23S rRNA (adenine(2503)-C(2))-methyltransferase RlmN [Puniceicoccus sp. CR14]WOO41177.1 23S rRNA (adenine(2503)-C(2))-methyltransferase RlmN [Puniceicoccus sp. CR14]